MVGAVVIQVNGESLAVNGVMSSLRVLLEDGVVTFVVYHPGQPPAVFSMNEADAKGLGMHLATPHPEGRW